MMCVFDAHSGREWPLARALVAQQMGQHGGRNIGRWPRKTLRNGRPNGAAVSRTSCAIWAATSHGGWPLLYAPISRLMGSSRAAVFRSLRAAVRLEWRGDDAA
ncbi:DNA-directed RNA polymerase V subunit 1 [Dorcoceras hygrometricum]|uniref:DNA-directed RNA polymerase V subunit 1 n=1 Tax=Dorcoceras hygrometricum TaxID=472368 RepID=A0A2Z7CT47_9LAMI|nr:DNA-directed RNA polymerase V subunit 1 [Dorcoceras hygrometricum]